jgi:hypothetical protein
MSRSTLFNGSVTRRALLRNLSVAVAAAATTALPRGRLQAAAAPHLDAKEAEAMALGYAEDAAQIDVKKYPTYIKGSNCDNCLLLQGTAGSHYRPCNLFPGKLVSVSGWCSGWTAEI